MIAGRRTQRNRLWLLLVGGLLLLTLGPMQATALEKYGRPLPSMDEPDHETREAEETLFGGYLLTGAFVKNPSFAARPDNTGLVGMRHMLHLETDIYKQYLTFYTDQNFFSDRTDGWIKLTEWDGTFAFTGVLNRFNWRLQYERDAPLDRSGIKQTYADVLVTARFQAVKIPGGGAALLPTKISPPMRKLDGSFTIAITSRGPTIPDELCFAM